MGHKFAAVVSANGNPVVIANGAEGEPASGKDRRLLSEAPHLVLDGLILAAAAVDAQRAYLYAPSDVLDKFVQPALAERTDRLAISTVASPRRFLSGEESAVVAAVGHRAAVPSGRPEPVYRSGLDNEPTLVHNVETLAHLALLTRRGTEWFTSIGDPADPGTRLFTLSGSVKYPGVYEHPTDISVGQLLEHAGGTTKSVQALLVGGYHGGWLAISPQQMQLKLTPEHLGSHGLAPGAGIVFVLETGSCGLRTVATIVTYLAAESTRQCGPCFNGLPLISKYVTAIAAISGTAGDVAELRRLLDVVEGRGACHHPTGVTRHVRSALAVFADELIRHSQGVCIERPVKIGGI